jgi:hypothetical protein
MSSLLGTLRRRARTALGESRLAGALGAAAENARVLAVPSALGRAVAHARVTAGLQTFRRWGRHSFLYRWLTKEPDPEVVVIDLRETYTVGPLIAVLDRLAGPLGRSYRQSGLGRLVDGLARVGGRLADTRVGRALGRALAPPEPPAEAQESDSPADSEEPSPEGAAGESPPRSGTGRD